MARELEALLGDAAAKLLTDLYPEARTIFAGRAAAPSLPQEPLPARAPDPFSAPFSGREGPLMR